MHTLHVFLKSEEQTSGKKIQGDVFLIQLLKTSCKNSGAFEDTKSTQNHHLAWFCAHVSLKINAIETSITEKIFSWLARHSNIDAHQK